jgi:hypothetical protein
MAQQDHSSAKDFFIHLLSSITLYISAIAFLMIAFQLIGYLFPGASIESWRGDYSSSVLRTGISMLIITLPVFIGTRLFLARMYTKDPSRKDFVLRKWLVYLTLFVASVIIIISLISTVNVFLSGDLTVRFVLKALATVLVAGLLFSYYLLDVRDELTKTRRNVYLWTTIIVSVALVGTTFVVVGSPQQARLARLDVERISDLNSLMYSVENYYSTEETLPTSIGDIPSTQIDSQTLVDPSTKEVYGYEVVGERAYKLCATFDTDTQDPTKPRDGGGSYYDTDWSHPKGEYCFDKSVQQTVEAKPVMTR